LDIIKVDDLAPVKKPTVTFSAKDKAGNPVPDLARLSFRLAGPTSDYAAVISEDARTAKGADGIYTWTFVNAIPATAAGTYALGIEGRREVPILAGTAKAQTVRDSAKNKTIFLTMDGSEPTPRRQVVSTEKCNSCHFALAFHGDSRNTVENCVLCHNPKALAGTGTAAASINFPVMIHRIHRGVGLTRPYKIGNASFNEIGYPGDLRNCAACHVNGSEALLLSEGLLPTSDPNNIMTSAMSPSWREPPRPRPCATRPRTRPSS
jgi:OmcA/MtrC family decaheme c-type cytochrome